MEGNVIRLRLFDYSPETGDISKTIKESAEMIGIGEKYSTSKLMNAYTVGKAFSDNNLDILEKYGEFDPLMTTMYQTSNDGPAKYDLSFDLVLNDSANPKTALKKAFLIGVDKPEILYDPE